MLKKKYCNLELSLLLVFFSFCIPCFSLRFVTVYIFRMLNTHTMHTSVYIIRHFCCSECRHLSTTQILSIHLRIEDIKNKKCDSWYSTLFLEWNWDISIEIFKKHIYRKDYGISKTLLPDLAVNPLTAFGGTVLQSLDSTSGSLLKADHHFKQLWFWLSIFCGSTQVKKWRVSERRDTDLIENCYSLLSRREYDSSFSICDGKHVKNTS